MKYRLYLIAILACVLCGEVMAAKNDRWSFRSPRLMSHADVHTVLNQNLKGTANRVAAELSVYLQFLCKKYKFDPAFVLSVIRTESAFNPTAVSVAGAIGLMQVQPETARFVVRQMEEILEVSLDYLKTRLTDPFFNLRVGVAYFAFLRDRYQGDYEKSLAAYNAGPAVVDKMLATQRVFTPVATRPFIERVTDGILKMRNLKILRGPGGV